MGNNDIKYINSMAAIELFYYRRKEDREGGSTQVSSLGRKLDSGII